MLTNHKIVSIQQPNSISPIDWPTLQPELFVFNQDICNQILTKAQIYLAANEMDKAIFGAQILVWQIEKAGDRAQESLDGIQDLILNILKAIPNQSGEHHQPTKRIFFYTCMVLESMKELNEKNRRSDKTDFNLLAVQFSSQYATELESEKEAQLSPEREGRNLGVYRSALANCLENVLNPAYTETAKTNAALIQYIHTFCTSKINLEEYITPEATPMVAMSYCELAETLSKDHPEKCWAILRRLYRRCHEFKKNKPKEKNAIIVLCDVLCKGYLANSDSSKPPIWLQRRQKLSELRHHLIGRFQDLDYTFPAQITGVYEALIHTLWTESIHETGFAPCKWAFLALGSMSQQLMTPYSDIEYMILIEDKRGWDIGNSRAYFTAVTELFQLKVQLMGEPNGFHVDLTGTDDEKNPAIIIKTSEEVGEYLSHLDEGFMGLRHSILHHRFLFGDQDLHSHLTLPEISIEEIQDSLETDFRQCKKAMSDLKMNQKFLEYCILSLKDLNKPSDHLDNIFDSLSNTSRISSKTKSDIKRMLLNAYGLRCKAQMLKDPQVDDEYYQSRDTIYEEIVRVLTKAEISEIGQDCEKESYISELTGYAESLCAEEKYLRAFHFYQELLSITPDPELCEKPIQMLHRERMKYCQHISIKNSHGTMGLEPCQVNGIISGVKRVQLPGMNESDYPESNHTVFNMGSVHIKRFPRFPAFEFAASRILHYLIGHGAAYCEAGELRSEPILISETISGRLLTDELIDDPKLKRLDQIKIQELIIAMMMIDHECLKSENVIVTSKGQLVCINNGSIFCSEIVTSNILFCLDQMNEPLSQECVDHFKRIDIYESLHLWRCSLEDFDEKRKAVFSDERTTQYRTKGTTLEFYLNSGVVTSIAERLQKIKELISINITPLDLLKSINESTYEQYESVFRESSLPAPHDRFQSVNEKCTVSAMVSTEKLDFSRMKEQLKAIFSSSGKKESIIRSMQNGNIAEWETIEFPHIQEDILNSWDWQAEENRSVAQSLLTSLTRHKKEPFLFTKLKLESCPITDRQLIKLIANMPHLVELELCDCEELMQNFGHLLARLSKLRKVKIDNLPNLVEFSNNDDSLPRGFTELYKAEILHCPSLVKLELLSCPALTRLVYQSVPKLVSLDLSESNALLESRIRNLLGRNLVDATDIRRHLDIQIEMPYFPKNLEDFLSSPCPFLQGQGKHYGFISDNPMVAETHTVFLMPPLSICNWQAQGNIQFYTCDRHGYPAKTIWFNDARESWAQRTPISEWAVMPKFFIPESHGRSRPIMDLIPKDSDTSGSESPYDPLATFPTYSSQYELSSAVELVAQICLHFLNTGEKLYGDNYKKYISQNSPQKDNSPQNVYPKARTKDMSSAKDYRVCIGEFDASGVQIHSHWDGYPLGNLGLAVRWSAGIQAQSPRLASTSTLPAAEESATRFSLQTSETGRSVS